MNKLIKEMIEYNAGDPKRIHHLLKVYEFAKYIAESEQLDPETIKIIKMAALTHDIGIKVSEKKHNSSIGKFQEIEGPPIAKDLLTHLHYDEEEVERVCYLIAHHHTYNDIKNIDYQILIEADFLVNAYEDEMKLDTIILFRDKYFKTKTGIKLLNTIYVK